MIKRLFSLSVWSKRGGVVRCKYVGCVHRHGCGCKWCDSWGREWPWRRQRRDDILHTRQCTSSVPTKCSWRISGARDTTSRKLWVLEPHPPVPSPHLHTHTHHCHTPIISHSLCIVSRQLECYPLFQTEINISPKLRKDAHDIILDFIRSRPTLKPVTVT